MLLYTAFCATQSARNLKVRWHAFIPLLDALKSLKELLFLLCPPTTLRTSVLAGLPL
jgi:hypothetical protein